jgi:hypothetical protein
MKFTSQERDLGSAAGRRLVWFLSGASTRKADYCNVGYLTFFRNLYRRLSQPSSRSNTLPNYGAEW